MDATTPATTAPAAVKTPTVTDKPEITLYWWVMPRLVSLDPREHSLIHDTGSNNLAHSEYYGFWKNSNCPTNWKFFTVTRRPGLRVPN